ncbi:hypothetical protein [Caniella muris]|uniref:hypothetical protein n=1 Tax=Caniella muris TaxID=2941502 RepID=UPI00203D942E|nr:hypothetical protein [Caniella muris]
MSSRTRCADPKRTILSIAMAATLAAQPTLAVAGTAVQTQDPSDAAVEVSVEEEGSTAEPQEAAPEGTGEDLTGGDGGPAAEEPTAGPVADEPTGEEPAADAPAAEAPAADGGSDAATVVSPEPVPTPVPIQGPAESVQEASPTLRRALAKEDLPAPTFSVALAEGFDADHVEVDRDAMTAVIDLTVTNTSVAADGTRLWACIYIDGLGSPYFMPGATRTVSWPVKVTSIASDGTLTWELPYRGYTSTDDVAGALTPASITSDMVAPVRCEVPRGEWRARLDPESYAYGAQRDDEGRWLLPIAIAVSNGSVASADTLRVSGERVATEDHGSLAAGERRYISAAYYPTEEEWADDHVDVSVEVTLHGETRTLRLQSHLPDRYYRADDETCPVGLELVSASVPEGASAGDVATFRVSVTNRGDSALRGPVRLGVGSPSVEIADDLASGETRQVDVPYTVRAWDVTCGRITSQLAAYVQRYEVRGALDVEIPQPEPSVGLTVSQAGDARLSDSGVWTVPVTVDVASVGGASGPVTVEVADVSRTVELDAGATRTVAVDVPLTVDDIVAGALDVGASASWDGGPSVSASCRAAVSDGCREAALAPRASFALADGADPSALPAAEDGTVTVPVAVKNVGVAPLSIEVRGRTLSLEPGAEGVVPVVLPPSAVDPSTGRLSFSVPYSLEGPLGTVARMLSHEGLGDLFAELPEGPSDGETGGPGAGDAEGPGDLPGDDGPDTPGDNPGEDPADDPVDDPDDVPGEYPDEGPDAPGDDPGEAPGDPSDDPAGDPGVGTPSGPGGTGDGRGVTGGTDAVPADGADGAGQGAATAAAPRPDGARTGSVPTLGAPVGAAAGLLAAGLAGIVPLVRSLTGRRGR